MWAILAVATSVCWGIGYAYSEKVINGGIAPVYLLLLIVAIEVPAYLLWVAFEGSFKSSTSTLLNDPALIKNTIITLIAFIIGNMLVFSAISIKNATHVNLIEITYPIVTILVTFLVFKTFHLTPLASIGGVLILSGAALIIYKG